LFLFQFVKEATNPIGNKTIDQPTSNTVKEDILSVSGPLVTFRAFKHGKRRLGSITETEYSQAVEFLQEDGCGKVEELSVCPELQQMVKYLFNLSLGPIQVQPQ